MNKVAKGLLIALVVVTCLCIIGMAGCVFYAVTPLSWWEKK